MILQKNTHKLLLILLSIFLIGLESKAQSNDCLKKLEYAFANRGSYVVEDAIHKNVIIATYKPSGNICYNGKVRVENGTIVTIFIELEDSTYEVYDKKFSNEKKTAPNIENGISELILSENGDKFKIIFIEKLKPKSKSYKEAELPDDL
ncbi:MAG: hypothetical protein KA264_03230 [Crocinitomicaceae bacterium]|nr:hypothetical protein [Crocinitomicaceae bacterium]